MDLAEDVAKAIQPLLRLKSVPKSVCPAQVLRAVRQLRQSLPVPDADANSASGCSYQSPVKTSFCFIHLHAAERWGSLAAIRTRYPHSQAVPPTGLPTRPDHSARMKEECQGVLVKSCISRFS